MKANSLITLFSIVAPLPASAQSDGIGSIKISGELKQWHKGTLTLDGPFAKFSLAWFNPREGGAPKASAPL